jgi:hypothetical protein
MSLILTDTDSFVLYIKTDDVYKDMSEMIKHYDTSNYPKDHPLFTNERKKKLGFFKDEVQYPDDPENPDNLETHGFTLMSEVASIRSKVYAYEKYATKSGCYKSNKTLKGISKISTKNHVTMDHYKDCIFKEKLHTVTVRGIRSFNCQNYSTEQQKLALSPYDDKRFIMPDGVNTYAYGHYRIRSM